MPRAPLRMILALIGLPSLLAMACSQTPPPAAPAAVPPSAPATVAPSAPAKPALAEDLPPDGVWLIDEQGFEYFVKEVPTSRPHHWLVPGERVRMAYGETFDVLAHDEETLQLKIYRVAIAPGAGLSPPPDPAVAERAREADARVAATYAFVTGGADRLRFRPFDAGLPRDGQWRNGFAIADMNRDGFLDIVHGPARKGRRQPNIFLGDGKGNWRTWSEARYPVLAYDYGDTAVADFNADGRPDIALGVHLRGLVVLASKGETEFELWSRGLPFVVAGGGVEAGFSSRAIAAADWNGDQRPDLIALGEGPRLGGQPAAGVQPPRPALGLAVFLNQGDGSWAESPSVAAEPPIHGEALAVADLDGDARPDALLGSSVRGAHDLLRRNRGDGSWSIAAVSALRPSAIVEAVGISDLDDDGRPDLLIGYRGAESKVWRTGVDLFFGSADGGFQRLTLWSETGRTGATAIAAGDLNGDGRQDLAALTGDGRTLVFLNDGKRRFSLEDSSELPAELGGCRGYDVQARDLDDDGRAELITEFAGESSVMYAPDACPKEGALRVWSSREQPAAD